MSSSAMGQAAHSARLNSHHEWHVPTGASRPPTRTIAAAAAQRCASSHAPGQKAHDACREICSGSSGKEACASAGAVRCVRMCAWCAYVRAQKREREIERGEGVRNEGGRMGNYFVFTYVYACICLCQYACMCACVHHGRCTPIAHQKVHAQHVGHGQRPPRRPLRRLPHARSESRRRHPSPRRRRRQPALAIRRDSSGVCGIEEGRLSWSANSLIQQ